MNKILVALLVCAFSSTALASKGMKKERKKLEGIKECKTLHMCKDKKGDEKVSCWSEKLACSKSNQDIRLVHFKTMTGKKNFANKKAQRISRLSERITKIEGKLAEQKQKLTTLKDKPKMMKMKEARIKHMNKKLQMINNHKAAIEAVN